MQFKISKYNLDEHWEELSEYYEQQQKELVALENEIDEVISEFEKWQNNQEDFIRTNPSHFGIDKITEGAVTSAIKASTQYNVYKDQLLLLRKKKNPLKGNISACEMQRKCLDGLTSLYVNKYFFNKPIPDMQQSVAKTNQDIQTEGLRNNPPQRLINRKKESK